NEELVSELREPVFHGSVEILDRLEDGEGDDAVHHAARNVASPPPLRNSWNHMSLQEQPWPSLHPSPLPRPPSRSMRNGRASSAKPWSPATGATVWPSASRGTPRTPMTWSRGRCRRPNAPGTRPR